MTLTSVEGVYKSEMGTVRFMNGTEPIRSVRKFLKRFRFRFGSVRGLIGSVRFGSVRFLAKLTRFGSVFRYIKQEKLVKSYY